MIVYLVVSCSPTATYSTAQATHKGDENFADTSAAANESVEYITLVTNENTEHISMPLSINTDYFT